MADEKVRDDWWYHVKGAIRRTPLIGPPLAALHRTIWPPPPPPPPPSEPAQDPLPEPIPDGATVEQIRAYMDRHFADGTAYRMRAGWDATRGIEIAQAVLKFIRRVGDPADLRILDIGCGCGGVVGEVEKARELVGIELSEVAVETARKNFGHRSDVRFLQMDATKPDFPDGYFDVAVARELVEHVPEPAKVIAGAHRVVRPGGLLVVTSPNRDSFHLRMNRLLGHADFMCSVDHVKEYTYSEMCSMITAAGFQVEAAEGVFFQPYWGIPEIDTPMRRYTDNDPEVIEWLRLIGRRVGPEFAFGYVIVARKPGGGPETAPPAV
ncbi:MAG: class I SAM-dependent methyltransferase [Planctomycetota bacterium]